MENETRKHIQMVGENIIKCVKNLLSRAVHHDASKLEAPEKELLEKYTPQLRGLTYGSPEYFEMLKLLDPALKHHYANNRHHPEYFGSEDSIDKMTLLDIIEMLCDWHAATKRHADGDIHKSIEINSKRFRISDQLKSILINTVKSWE